MVPLALLPQQSLDFFQDLVGDGLREYADAIRVALAPIEALHLIAQNGTLNRETIRQNDFERIALNLGRDRTKYRKSDLFVVSAWRKNHSRAPTSLLVTSLGIE